MFYGARPSVFEKAKELRKNMTDAEKQLWDRINRNQLGVRFKAQHPIYKFVVDFYCHKYKLVIEIDGEIHNFQKQEDEGREEELKRLGLKIIRFTNDEVKEDLDRVVDEIKKELYSEMDWLTIDEFVFYPLSLNP